MSELQPTEAEISVLGAIMLDEAAADRAIEALRPEDFAHPRHRAIFTASRGLRERGYAPEPRAVLQELREEGALDRAGGENYLAEIVEIVPTAANLEYHMETVRDRALKRSLLKVVGEIGHSARNGRAAREVLADAERRVFALSERGQGGDPVQVGSILEDVQQRLERREEDACSTPWPALNKKLGGGVHPGEFVVVAARPSIGKTQFAMQLGLRAARWETGVLLAHLELGETEVVRRLLGLATRLPAELLKKSARRSKDQEEALAAGVRVLRRTNILLAAADRTIGSFEARARRFARSHPRPLLIVDYLQLMDGPKDGNRTQEVGAVSRALKRLAVDLDCFVVAACQLNREIERRAGHPQLADLRESGDIEADADVVCMLERPEFGKIESEIASDERGLCRVWLAKNRNGETGRVDLHFDGSTGTFTERARR